MKYADKTKAELIKLLEAQDVKTLALQEEINTVKAQAAQVEADQFKIIEELSKSLESKPTAEPAGILKIEIDGTEKSYQLECHSFIYEHKEYTAAEVAADTALLLTLIELKAGFLKEII